MEYIRQFRTFSRSFTQILGILNNEILASSFSLIESRIIYELGTNKTATAKLLSTDLNLDKGYLSRVLKKLVREQYVSTKASENDRRVKNLYLTQKGIDTFRLLDSASEDQIRQLLSSHNEYEKKRLIDSLNLARQLLEKHKKPPSLDKIDIRNKLELGDIGFVIQAHSELYGTEYNYSYLFEQYVVKSLMTSLMQEKPNRNRAWVCEHQGNKIGFLFLADHGESAQLRYFFLYPEFRGIGLGRKLMNLFMTYLKAQEFKSCFLWTTNEQEMARSLYLKYGFALVEEKASTEFGKSLFEQKYVLNLFESD